MVKKMYMVCCQRHFLGTWQVILTLKRERQHSHQLDYLEQL